MSGFLVDYTPDNGSLDYDQIKDLFSGVYLKAAEGVTIRPRTFANEWRRAREAKAAGIIRWRGAYSFLHGRHLTIGDIPAEVANLLDTVKAAGGLEPGDFLVPDIEAGGFGEGPHSSPQDNVDVRAYTRAWRDELERQAPGVPKVWYTGDDFARRRIFGQPDLDSLPWMIANYPKDQTRATIPARFNQFHASFARVNVVGWQYGGDITGSPFNIKVDVNYISDEFERLLDPAVLGTAAPKRKERQVFFFWHENLVFLAAPPWRSPHALPPEAIDPLMAQGVPRIGDDVRGNKSVYFDILSPDRPQ